MKVRLCSNCGYSNPEGAWYCQNEGCGQALSIDTITEIDGNIGDVQRPESPKELRTDPFTHASLEVNKSKGAMEMGTEGKRRHGCLAAWLIVMGVGNLLITLGLHIVGPSIRQELLGPGWSSTTWNLINGGLNIVFVIALFKWRKWGFWGFAAFSIFLFVNNLISGISIVESLLVLVGVSSLYIALQVGSDNKGWPQLE